MTDAAFEAAVERYADMLFRLAYSYLKSRADAEDVMQETLLKLYTERTDFDSPEHERYWVVRVAVNESRKVLRSPWRRRTLPLEGWDGAAEEEEPSGVLEAVLALEGKYRLPVYLYYYEGYSVQEAAAILGLNPSTVQTRLQRAREKLKKALTEEGEGDKCSI